MVSCGSSATRSVRCADEKVFCLCSIIEVEFGSSNVGCFPGGSEIFVVLLSAVQADGECFLKELTLFGED